LTIPASFFVGINPSVIGAPGNPLALNGLFFTQNTAMPTNTVLNFASALAVSNYFGPSSAEAAAAVIYFAGYTKATLKPGGMLFAAFNLAARDAFLTSGSFAGVSLTALQALAPGALTITMDGAPETSASINLSGATSFSNAASLIQAGFTTPGFTVAWNPVSSTFVFTNTASGATSTLSFATGVIATGLLLTAATGAFLSQGAAADTPATAMANAIAISQNFASIVTLWEPTVTDKENFAIFLNSQDDQYLYLAWDSDVNASVQGNTTCFGAVAKAAAYNSVAAFSGDPALAASTGVPLATLAMNLAIFAAGAIASINFNQTKGRTSLAFLTSGSISPTCANLQIGKNLLANGYNFYGSVATANQGFVFLYNGQMFGPFVSIVRYINQIWMNSQFQLSLLTLFTEIGSVGYEPADYGLIRNTLADPIAAALNFGAFRTNVKLSAAQIAEVNQAAGVDAASVIQTQGSYLQILDPGAQARALGQTPIINFWYADGGDILQIQMASTAIL
jgi:hypothetical protein